MNIDPAYGDELSSIAESVKAFSKNEIAPHVLEWDKAQAFPNSIFQQLGALGVLGVSIPESDGGLGLGADAVSVIMEELSYVDPAVCLSYLAHSLLFVHNLAQNASPEQKEKYLPDTISGTRIGGMGMTEPNAGSDAVGMQTRAVRKGDTYILNGSKMFITNAPQGDVFLVYARTGDERLALSTFIVESSFPGFSRGSKLDKMGMRASATGELVFEDCEVPLANRVGEEGDCVRHMMKNLDIERVGLAAMALGIMRACSDHCLEYSTDRKQFSEPIISFQSVSERIANMYVAYKASKALVMDAARIVDSGQRANQEAAAAKIMASESATKVGLDAIQILGGYGYITEYPVEKLMRDAKLLEIGGGTSEILRGVIIKEFLRRS